MWRSARCNTFQSAGARSRERLVCLKAEEAVLDTADGERVIVWHVPPREEQPFLLYFHGNGGSLRWRDERFRALISDGSGLIALSYRGYGGSSGRPTERASSQTQLRPMRSQLTAILPTASFLWANRSDQQSQSHWRRQTGRRRAEAPVTSAADVGARHYRFVPVGFS